MLTNRSFFVPTSVVVACSNSTHTAALDEVTALFARNHRRVTSLVGHGLNAAGQWRCLESHLKRHQVDLVLADQDFSGVLPLLMRPLGTRPTLALLGLVPWSPAGPAQAHRLLADHYLQLGIPGFEREPPTVAPNFRFIGTPSTSSIEGGAQSVVMAPELASNTQHADAVRAALAMRGQDMPLATSCRPHYASAVARARLAICGPSLDSILLALRSGAPVLCLGVEEDARELGARLECRHAGIGLHDKIDAATLSCAFDALRRLPRFRHGATALSIEYEEFDADCALLNLCRPRRLPTTPAFISVGSSQRAQPGHQLRHPYHPFTWRIP